MTKDINILDNPLKIISGEPKGFLKADFFLGAINPIITTVNTVAEKTKTSLSSINQTIGESTSELTSQITSLRSTLDLFTEESDLVNPNAPSSADHNDVLSVI